MEQDRLQWFVPQMVEAFIQDNNKRLTKVAESVALGAGLQRKAYRKPLLSFITNGEESRILDVDLIQGVVQLALCALSGFLISDDLVKILSILRMRL